MKKKIVSNNKVNSGKKAWLVFCSGLAAFVLATFFYVGPSSDLQALVLSNLQKKSASNDGNQRGLECPEEYEYRTSAVKRFVKNLKYGIVSFDTKLSFTKMCEATER